jgi:tetratricopeptide (TPR) repeat protein
VRAGQGEAAIPYFQKALAIDPKAPEVHGNLGLILSRQGRYDEAIPHLEQALSGGFESAEAHLALGRALAERGRFDEAIPHFEKVATTDDPLALGALSSLYARVGRLADALRAAKQGLAVATQRGDRDLIQAFNSSIALYEKAAAAPKK